MATKEELLNEATAARREARAAKTHFLAKRGEASEAKKLWKEAAARVEEILDEADPELEEAERPMLAMLHRKQNESPATNGEAAAPPRKSTAKRDRPDTKLAGLQMPTVREIIHDLIDPEVHSVEELGLSISVLNRVKAAGIKTVGDLAGDKCPHGLEGARVQAMAYIVERRQSPAPTPEVAPESKPRPSNTKEPAAPTVWNDDDVDAALMQALIVSGGTWAPMIHGGATNQQIANALEGIWPKTRQFISRADSGTREGYTVSCPDGNPAFWLGAYAPDRQPTLYGVALIERVRKLLEIPTPHQVEQLAKREAVIKSGRPKVTSVVEPKGGWDEASILNAAEDLGVERKDVIICGECRAARVMKFGLAAKGNLAQCPCGSNAFHSVADELIGRRPARSPARKGESRASRRA